MLQLVKMSMKLLLRNKGFWFFLLAMPVLSVAILHVKTDEDLAFFREETVREIKELYHAEDKVAYYGKSGEFVVKVYDASESTLSEMFLENLAKNGLFLICRAKTPEFSKSDADAAMARSGIEDRMGAGIYLAKGFDEAVLSGDMAKGMTIYLLSEDERFEIFEREIKGFLAEAKTMAQLSGKEGDALASELEKFHSEDPEKTLRSMARKGSATLTKEQVNHKAHMGYSFSFLTLCFVFCGVIVAHTTIEEEKHKVLTRIQLTGTSNLKYFVSKFVVSAIVSVMITGVLAVLTLFIGQEQLGMSKAAFLGLVFLMGLIFNSLSLLLGILSGEVMTANFMAFTIWSLSCMLAGLYFPLDDASRFVKTVSYVMPQRWFMDSVDQIFMGDKRGYFMVLCITTAYLIIILSLGGVGLKVKKIEQ